MPSKHDSTFTWPRSLAPPKLSTTVSRNDSTNILLSANLANIKQFIKKNNNDKAKKLVNIIQMFLNPESGEDNRHVINTIQEEPPFESMVVTEASKEKSALYVEKNVDPQKKESGNALPDSEVAAGKEEEIRVEDLPEPFWVRCLPHLCLITLAVLYLIFGTFAYQFIDPAYASKPFHTVLTMAFQVCFTIGWGNIPPLIGISRLFTLVYAAFGVPLTFAVVSNFGRFISEGYGVKWLFLSNFCPRKDNRNEDDRQQLALKDASALLLSHQFVGIILFNTWYAKLGIIEAWYFIWVTSAMIGFGDIIPDPKSLFQAITMCIYFALGNVFMQAFLLSICHHIHRAYFVIFKMYLFKLQYFFQKKLGETL
uniref:Potassium channel domain-containing protein n=1 Tax=Panagrolaimus sp. ES5 TaxID=591445 RepID=A0AC34FBS5_9BILA